MATGVLPCPRTTIGERMPSSSVRNPTGGSRQYQVHGSAHRNAADRKNLERSQDQVSQHRGFCLSRRWVAPEARRLGIVASRPVPSGRASTDGRSPVAPTSGCPSGAPRLDGLTRIGIDEISYKRGYRYITVVVDHDSGRLLWAAPAETGHAAHILRPARCRPLRADHPRFGRLGRLDRRGRHRTLPGRGAVRRPDPHRRLGHRSPRRGPPPGLERGPPLRADPRHGPWPLRRRRRCETAQECPLRVIEELRQAHRQAGQAGLDRQDRPAAAPCLPAQRRPAVRLPSQGRGRQAGAGPVAVLGPSLPNPGLRQPRPAHHRRPRPHRRHPRPRPVQRPDRVGQHQDPADHPHRVRLPLTRRPDRPGHAQPRRHKPTLPGRA